MSRCSLIAARGGRMDSKGGNDGAAGRTEIIHRHGTKQELPGKCTARLKKGDRVRVESPGGGGWGEAKSN